MKYLLYILLFLSCQIEVRSQLFQSNSDPSKVPFEKKMHEKMTMADFDKNGFLDILSFSKENGQYTASIYQNDSASFELHSKVLPIFNEFNYEVSDINNDNQMDVIIASKISPDSIQLQVYLGDGKFHFNSYYQSRLGGSGILLIADFDNDGQKDLLLSTSEIKCHLYRHKNSTFQKLEVDVPSLASGSYALLDADANGRMDVFANGKLSDGTPLAGLYVNNQLVFKPHTSTAPAFKDVSSVGDYTMDGQEDLYLSGLNDLLQRTSMVVQLPSMDTILLPGIPLLNGAAMMADFNHDGFTDILLNGRDNTGQQMAGVYLQKQARFVPLFQGNSQSQCYVGYGDLNADGNLDVCTSTFQDTIGNQILYNVSEKNEGPLLAGILSAIQLDNLLFIISDGSVDDVTPSKGMSYDIFLGEQYNPTFNTAETNIRNGRRLVSRSGAKLGNPVAYFENLPLQGTTLLGIVPIDNSFATQHYDTTATGKCVALSSVLREIARSEQKYCEKKEVVFTSSSGKEALWYSRSLGLLGKSVELKYFVKEADVIYCLQIDPMFLGSSFVLTLLFEKPTPLGLGNDLTLCQGDTSKVNPLGRMQHVKEWTVDGSLSSIFPSEALNQEGKHVLIVSNKEDNCFLADTMEIMVLAKPVIEIANEVKEDGIVLTVSGGVSYLWHNLELPEDTAASSILVKPALDKYYHVTATDKNKCISKDSIFVEHFMGTAVASKSVYVPGLFSPNGDQQNDVFQIYGEDVAELKFGISDRNGNKVFEGNSIMDEWDGTAHGKPMPEGVYFWELSGRFRNGKPVAYQGNRKGSFTLVR